MPWRKQMSMPASPVMSAGPIRLGKVGVFSRAGGPETWTHPISEHETYAVHVHPTDPNVVFAGTKDGVYRSTDKGKTFQRANFPDARQIWSFLVDSENPKLVYAGGSPISIYRSEDTGETWKEMPDPGMPIAARDAVRLPRHADGATSEEARHDLRRARSERRDAHQQ